MPKSHEVLIFCMSNNKIIDTVFSKRQWTLILARPSLFIIAYKFLEDCSNLLASEIAILSSLSHDLKYISQL